jgi:2-hydroxy-3-keto-5-methylthiopentenyl-1-phosphate phosphatase
MSKNKIIYVGSEAADVKEKEKADILGSKTTLITQTTGRETSYHSVKTTTRSIL